MKYLFTVQGEGRGHLTQAISMAQLLRSNGHEVVEVLMGQCENRQIPSFFEQSIGAPIMRYNSPAMSYSKDGTHGRIFRTVVSNLTPRRVKMWIESIRLIRSRIEATKPDVVINFYETLMGVTNLRYRLGTKVVTLAHQFLIDHPLYKHAPKSAWATSTLKFQNMMCALRSDKILALSFYELEPAPQKRIVVVPPLLRSEIFTLRPSIENHILGYMLNPGFMSEVVEWRISSTKNSKSTLQIFWDKQGAPEDDQIMPDVWAHRISDTKFLKYMEKCRGYVTTAGFESICEAFYLGKPVLLIPTHIEQQVNARDASSIGAGTVAKSFNISQLEEFIPRYKADVEGFRKWVDSAPQRFLDQLTQF